MKSIDKRLAALEQHQPGPLSVYVVYSTVGADYVWADGEGMPLDLFALRYPRVDLASLKAYGATAEFNPEAI
jgi:hypothetical protein